MILRACPSISLTYNDTEARMAFFYLTYRIFFRIISRKFE